MTFLVSILVLGVLIFVHELGHFLVAKYFNVGVLEFSIGFGKKIWRKKIGETTYSLGVVPLGGYVRMVGDEPGFAKNIDAHSQEGEAWGYAEIDESDRKLFLDRKRWFLEQPVLPRMAIVFAGPLFNYLFAVLLAVFAVWHYGKSVPIDKPVIGAIIPNYPAERAGLKEKDLVRSIDGQELISWEDLARKVAESEGKEMNLRVERADEQDAGKRREVEIRVAGTPDIAELKLLDESSAEKKDQRQFKIGITPDSERVAVGVAEAAWIGFYNTYYVAKISLKGLWGMIRGAISPNNIAGPIFIFKEAAQSAKRGLEHLFDFMVFLSVSLAVLNLLPVPILDGGHLAFFLIESIRGKALSLRVQEVCNQVGMFLLLALMVFAISNDVIKLVK